MENLEEAQKKILKELTEEDVEVRGEFLKLFSAEVIKFSEAMAEAFLNWRTLDLGAEKNDKHAYISALVYTSIHLHILSMKLFISGFSVAAGNLFRQVVETIALTLLCSGKDLIFLDKFMKNEYSTQKSVQDLFRHKDRLGLKRNLIEELKNAVNFYHKYSHISLLTIASWTSFSKKSQYVGSSFDQGKIELYKKEINGRINLAVVLSNFIDGVKTNFEKWELPQSKEVDQKGGTNHAP
jgi:hypothetical protein